MEPMEAIKREIHEIRKMVDVMHSALVGNPLADDGGLVRHMQEIEHRQEGLDDQFYVFEKANVRLALYVKLLWGMGGGIVISIFTIVIQSIIKK